MAAVVRPVPNAQLAVSEDGTDLGVARQFDFPDVTVVGGVATVNTAAATHTHAGADIDSGTVEDARIASTLARDSEVTAAVSAHEGAANPHAGYETSAEAQAKVDAHAGAADPHSGYLTPAEGAAAYDAIGAAAAAQAAAIAASQPVDADLTAIAALTTTAYGRAFLALADAAAGRTALGLGTAAVAATGDFDAAGAAAAAQSASQPADSDLTAIAALTTTAFGRGLLTLADQAALLSAAGASASGHDHSDTFDDHSARHENGGADEISVAGLSGTLADAQTPAAHAASHQDAGADEISIAGLAGVPAELTTHAGAADPHTGYVLESALFDATAPTTQAFGDTAAAGTSGVAADRAHLHGMPAEGVAISALPAVTTPAATDEFVVNQGGTTKKMTLAQVTSYGWVPYDRAVLEMTGLVAHWPLGEIAGTRAVDIKGGLHGTYVATPVLGETGLLTGDPSTAVLFNGSSQYVTVADNAALDITGACSYCLWVNVTTVTGNQALIDKGANARNIMMISGKVQMGKSGVAWHVTSASAVSLGRHFIVGTHATSSAADHLIYVDGVDVSAAQVAGTVVATAAALQIGAGAGPASYFPGTISKVSIFSRVITPAEVAALYAIGA